MRKIGLFFGIIALIFGTFLVEGADYPEPFTSDSAVVISSSSDISSEVVANLNGASQVGEPSLSSESYEFISDTESNRKELWSKKGVCEITRGCFDSEEETCYPFGYIRSEQYCGDKASLDALHPTYFTFGFLNQSDSGEKCIYDFECKSNFCFNRKCVEDIKLLIVDILRQVSVLETSFNNFQLGLDGIKDTSLSNDEVLMEGATIEEGEKVEGDIKGFFARIFG